MIKSICYYSRKPKFGSHHPPPVVHNLFSRPRRTDTIRWFPWIRFVDNTNFLIAIAEKPNQTFTPSVLGSELWMELEDHQEASGTLESPVMGPIRQWHILNNRGSQETNGSLLHGLLRWRGKDMFLFLIEPIYFILLVPQPLSCWWHGVSPWSEVRLTSVFPVQVDFAAIFPQP